MKIYSIKLFFLFLTENYQRKKNTEIIYRKKCTKTKIYSIKLFFFCRKLPNDTASCYLNYCFISFIECIRIYICLLRIHAVKVYNKKVIICDQPSISFYNFFLSLLILKTYIKQFKEKTYKLSRRWYN